MKKIIITGGSGFIGTLIIKKLLNKGYFIINLDQIESSIKDERLLNQITDTSKYIPDIIDENIHAVINLAGVKIFGKFTDQYKKLIYDSRILTTRNIVSLIEKNKNIKVLVNASAIGYYGNTKGLCVHEGFNPGDDFLARVCVDWENEALKIKSNTRVVILRTAHVIGKGGLISVLIKLFKYSLGGYFSGGRQHMPWIGANDLVNMYINAIENDSLNGIYNTAIKNPTQKDFMNTIKRFTKSFMLWNIPLWSARLIYGDFADSLVTDVCVDNNRILETGFVYSQTDLFETICEYYR